MMLLFFLAYLIIRLPPNDGHNSNWVLGVELYIGEIWQSRRETSSTKDFWRVATNTLLNNGVSVLEQTELDHLIWPGSTMT